MFILSVVWWKIFGLAQLINLRINQKKCANLKFADSHTSEICGFAIGGLMQNDKTKEKF
jgi:hypothetical protein